MEGGIRMELHESEQKYADFFDRAPVPILILFACVLNLLIESMARQRIFGGFVYLFEKPLPFLLGMLLILTTLSVSLLVRRRVPVLLLISSAWLLLGIINAVVIGMRAAPLSGIDFAILRSCLPIVKVYLTWWQVVLIAVGLVGLVFLLVRVFKKARRYRVHLGREGSAFLATVLSLITVYMLSVRVSAVSAKLPELMNAYDEYGFVYCFSMSVLDRGVTEPEHYSENDANALANTLRKSGDGSAADRPDIVVVQLESFFDAKRLDGMAYSENPVPVFDALMETYPSGRLRVPLVGAGTANTEFEVLTGIPLEIFGAGEYPYTTILREESCESAASICRSLGYGTHALHNNSGSFYFRHEVYGNLGFSTFTPLEYMNDVELNSLGWAKDSTLTSFIGDCLDAEDGPGFVFAVSVQGHGLYPTDYEPGEDDILVYGVEDEDQLSRMSYYVNEIHDMDAFLAELTEFLERRSERTGRECVLVLYGDHLPSLSLDYDEVTFTDGSDAFDSEYVIWSTADLGLENADLETWQLMPRLFSALGLRGADGSGLVYRCHEKYGNTRSFLSSVSMIGYDMLYGERYAWGGKNPIGEVDFRMGLCNIVITSAEETEDGVVLHGENFTPSSSVRKNRWYTKTEFVSPGELLLPGEDLSEGDVFTVVQRSEDFVTLGSCEPFTVRGDTAES